MNKKFFVILGMFMLFITNSTFSQKAKLHTAFIYNFIMNVEWPASYKSGNFIIGVLGNCEIVNELKNMASKKKRGNQPIKIQVYNSINDINNCHVLYVCASKSGKLAEVSQKLANKATLIISDTKDGTSKGAIINLLIIGGKQRFELSKKNAAAHNLKVSSTLQSLGILK